MISSHTPLPAKSYSRNPKNQEPLRNRKHRPPISTAPIKLVFPPSIAPYKRDEKRDQEEQQSEYFQRNQRTQMGAADTGSGFCGQGEDLCVGYGDGPEQGDIDHGIGLGEAEG